MRVFTEDEVKDLVVELVENLNPAMASQTDLRSETDRYIPLYGSDGESFSPQGLKNFTPGELKQVSEAMEQAGIDESEVVELVERQKRFEESDGRQSKVEYWIEKIQDSGSEYTCRSDVPRENHDMAVKSSATYAKLGRRLENSDQ